MNSIGFKSLLKLASFRNLAIVAPIFLLTIKGWMGIVTFILFVGAVHHLKKGSYPQIAPASRKWFWALTLALAGPLAAVIAGQFFRQELDYKNFDPPLRLVFGAVIFCATAHGWLHEPGKQSVPTLWIQYVFPLGMIWTYLDRPSWTQAWGATRITTYFVDPLSFGHLCLLFALLSFAGLSFYWAKSNWQAKLISTAGILCGLYLSAMSGSRTGWGVIPIIFVLWLIFFAIKKYPLKIITLIMVSFLLALLAAVSFQPILINKFRLIFTEIKEYHWSEVNGDGSVAVRISFYRMAIFYLSQNLLGGWGDLGWLSLKDAPELSVYASASARDFPRNGFHNEILTNAVRSGLWGLVSSVAIFLIPMVWLSKHLRSNKTQELQYLCLAALFVVLHFFIAGLTDDVMNLVFLASFVGLAFAVFWGEIFYITHPLSSVQTKSTIPAAW